MSDENLCFRTATELAAMLRTKEVSAREVLAAHRDRIEKLNPTLNAIVTHTPELAEQQAAAADEAIAAGTPLGPLHGLPIAHKDLHPTAGVLTTFGSPAMADNIPTEDHPVVTLQRAAGAVTMGKTNTPEWGTGSHTDNEVFGLTRNPWDTTRSAGGSSGGAAAALAARMLPLADGSDMGGSLRNPASFNNVVGLRPSLGRVPAPIAGDTWFAQSVSGPMARTVTDLALLLSVQGQWDSRAPYSHRVDPAVFRDSLARDLTGVKVAWSPDLSRPGFDGLAIDDDVRDAMAPGRDVLADLGMAVGDAAPDLSEADEVFRTWRSWWYGLALGDLYREQPEKFGASAGWNVEQGLALTAEDLMRAARMRSALYTRTRGFFEEYEYLVTMVSPVAPFDGSQRYPETIAGKPQETYLDWMRGCYWISATGMPAASIPIGFTDAGLPVGIQLVGRPGDDLGVLQLAYAIEQATHVADRIPQL